MLQSSTWVILFCTNGDVSGKFEPNLDRTLGWISNDRIHLESNKVDAELKILDERVRRGPIVTSRIPLVVLSPSPDTTYITVF